MRCTTSAADPGFTMIAHGAAPRCRLRLVGELDLVTAPALQQMLDRLSDSGHRYLGLELSELTFLAAAGLHVFEQADRQFRDAGGWLVLIHPTARIRDLLQISELHTALTVHPHPCLPPDCPTLLLGVSRSTIYKYVPDLHPEMSVHTVAGASPCTPRRLPRGAAAVGRRARSDGATGPAATTPPRPPRWLPGLAAGPVVP